MPLPLPALCQIADPDGQPPAPMGFTAAEASGQPAAPQPAQDTPALATEQQQQSSAAAAVDAAAADSNATLPAPSNSGTTEESSDTSSADTAEQVRKHSLNMRFAPHRIVTAAHEIMLPWYIW